MYKPADRADKRNLEFIELYNSNPWPEDIGGFRLDGDVQYTFPVSTKIAGQGYIVIAAAPADMQAVHGLTTNVFGPCSNSLKTSGALRLHDEQGSVLLELEYDNAAPWPMGADGSGHSIVLARASYGEADARAWDRSDTTGGSPGREDTNTPSLLRNVVLNEVLAHTDPPLVDSIELYNHGNSPVNLAGCTLSDEPDEDKFVIPGGVVIPARGFVYFTEAQLGFGLNAAGETIYFKNPGGTRVLDALRFGAQENAVALGRYPDGGSWTRLKNPTLGSGNAAPLVSAVGFNEIMYHPISGDDDDQFVELYNQSTNPVDLSGWRLAGGISFTFPQGQVIPGKGYLVVGRNAARLRANYPQLNPANTIGDFQGSLSRSGERLTLTKPDLLVTVDGSGPPVTNHVNIVVDEVTYGTGGRWGRWADGGGSSLELRDARTDKRLAANWADSDESAKAPWVTVETTGVLDNGAGGYTSLQLGLLDPGECLIDDVEVRLGTAGPNLANNPGFENGMTSLSFQGDHSRSSLDAGAGFPSGGTALHLRTGDSVLTGPNGVQMTAASGGLGQGQVATLRFKARWLRGCPEPLLRFMGCDLEATTRLPLPSNLGTPGLPNSRATTNAGPAIYEVRHDPAVPAANQPVVVTARIADPDPLQSVQVQYRVDNFISTPTDVSMNDSGVDGDAVAGDGIFSATVPGRSPGAIAFALFATDAAGASNRFPELIDDNAPVRECVVYFGDPTPTNLFGTYHLWLTRTNVNRWKQLPPMSNEDIDGTLVYNNRVIYNMGGRYSGSPWHQNYDGPNGNRACHYVWSMPKDDLLLGASSFNKIHWPGNDIQNDTITSINNDPTLQREQAAYMFLRSLGVPWSYRRFVAVYVNGVRRGKLMEDAFRPTGGTIKDQYLSGDTGVQLYKLQRWYSGSSVSLISECRLALYLTTGGVFKAARYRPNWALKESPDSLSNFTNVYALVRVANAETPNYPELLESVADMENWMRVSAANHAVGNWDAFGSGGSGQNMDAWVSDQTRWTLFTIDLSICLDNQLSGVGLTSMNDPAWQRMLNTPRFRRMYWRALDELANGIMRPEVVNPLLDAKYNAFLAAGITASAPTSTKNWIANQRSSILSQLASANAAFSVTSDQTIFISQNHVTLTGLAPFNVVTISVNGVDFVPVWTSPVMWSLTLPAPTGTNSWTIQARDRHGNLVGGTFNVMVFNTGVPASPVGNVVFNEIMFHAPVPEAEYVELFNRSANTTFDLSGWVVNGLGYTFPPGTLLPPLNYLVLAKSSTAFAATYGALVPVFDTFNGNLQSNGETLSLIKPGTAPEPDVIVDQVRYEAVLPWPQPAAAEAGVSLQLIDPAQDNSRAGNWAAGPPGAKLTPGAANSVSTVIPPFPTIWLNEVHPENITGPSDNFDEREPWVELYNSGPDFVSLDGLFLGTNYGNPLQWAFPAGILIAPGQFLTVWLDGETAQTSGAILHAGFPLDPASGSIVLSRLFNGQPQVVDYLNFQPLPPNQSYGDVPDGQPFHRQAMFHFTPAGTNNAALPAIDVTLNEWMAENDGGLINPATGKYDDWFELHNHGGTPADLTGYYLSDSLLDPFQYEIPAGFQIPANGFLLVWADDEIWANTNTAHLHVPFKLSKGGEAITLFTPQGTAVDAVVFGAQSANVSEGRYPDSGTLRLFMPQPTPGAPNIPPPASGPPVVSSIAIQPDQSCLLTFEASPGHFYRLEYTEDLSEGVWWPLGEDVLATETTAVFSDVPDRPQRFYRVVLVQ